MAINWPLESPPGSCWVKEEKINLKLLGNTCRIGCPQAVWQWNSMIARSLVLRLVTVTDNAAVAFQDCDYAFLVGAKPRGPGMERE